MTGSRPFGYYSYFFRMFRVLAFEAAVTCGRMVLCLSSKEHFCITRINVFEILGEGSGPVETTMGESCDSRRKMSRSAVFDIVEVSVQVNVKSAQGQFGCFDRLSRLVLGETAECGLVPGFGERVYRDGTDYGSAN